ncbi:TRAP transporter substrate-binding protein DctP [Ammoniphilus sp. CFH 90114]|uniref:TRAP transporter substrate-binding protein DctP n=1 Tax=Ammoniphilus sp. CFH 90114 TaxID=2493665 RepID=UPI00100E6E26|nr:TRAP transporter substrate-binding protein DctP [Ammoniphilus sp. CFH 90114]RXT08039.1 hypothetical protein EIZ39_11555 [Ammoniphilus sp. CFH 90114]
MRKEKRYSLLCMMLAALVLAVVGCGGQGTTGTSTQAQGDAAPSSPKPVELKAVSFLAVDHPFTKDVVPLWMKTVEEETQGAVKIDWIGGPESVPVKEQFDAVRNGMVDIGFNVSSYYGHLMPESHSLHLSPYTPWEEREKGYFDYMSKQFEGQGLVYLGRWLGPSPFYFWSNKEVKSLDELKGLKFRSNPTYHDIMTAVGMVPVEIVPGEVYTSLERKMVDGFGFPLLGPHQSGWTEVTKYVIEEPFLNQNATILMNSDAFNSLSPDIQEKMLELTAAFEKEMVEHFNQENEKEWNAIQQAGVTRIKLPDAESEKFRKLVRDVKWESLQKTAPEQYDDLKKLLYQE